MDGVPDDATDDAVLRLQDARPTVPVAQTESALARLRTALFGAAPRHPTLTRYPIVRKIGEGGAGIVYLAHDVELDRPVAVKLIGSAIDRQSGSGSTSRERLLREAEAIARAPHPNILAIYDVGTAIDRDGEPCTFLVLEYVEGADLKSWLAGSHPWQRVLEVFVAAGQGLAAAHAAGVTHRDFKPANAIVGSDGRVRVLDFGLARTPSLLDARRTLDDDIIEVQLTEEGTVVGTPAYMSPEQHAGGVATPASDQYGFCVALWEGLFGARPFSGQSLAELAIAKRRGPRRPPSGHTVPAAIVRALRRGLEPAPSRRFAGMHELLAALGQKPTRHRLRLTVGLGVVAVAVAAVAWKPARDPRCSEGDGVARAGGPQRSAIEAATATIADESRDRLAARIDRFDAAWRAGNQTLCEAGPASIGPDAFDRSMACLRVQDRDAEAVLTVLADADKAVLDRALEIADALPDPSICADQTRLLADIAPPADPKIAARVVELRAELTRVNALDTAGKIEVALAAVRLVTDEAATLGHVPLLAEALHLQGNVEKSSGEWATAARTLEAAHATAVACNHNRTAAHAAQNLVFVVGYHLRDLDRALRWAEEAKVAIERLGHDADPSRLSSALASAYGKAGRAREAVAASREALAAYLQRENIDDGRLGLLHNNVGDALREVGDLDGAAASLAMAKTLWEKHYGPGHPRLAMVLTNLGIVDLWRHDPAAAELKFRAVLEQRERLLGPDHPLVVTSLANLALALRDSGKLGEARAALTRASAILRTRGPSEDALLVTILNGLGNLDVADGRHEAALATFGDALLLARSALPAEHPSTGRLLAALASTRVQLGDIDAALADFAATMEISIAVYGAGEAKVASARLEFVEVLEEHGFSARARAIAIEARAALTDGAAPVAAELDTWLREHGGAPP